MRSKADIELELAKEAANDPKATFVTVTLTCVADVVKSAWGALEI